MPATKSFTLIELAHRTFLSNYYRNNWLVYRRLWFSLDPFVTDCGYLNSFIIPKMNLKKNKKNVINYCLEVEEIKGLDEVEVDYGTVSSFKAIAAKSVDMDQIYANIFIDMADDPREYFREVTYNWDTTFLPMSVNAYKLQGGNLSVLVVTMSKMAPDLASAIEEGVLNGKNLLLKINQENAEIDKQQQDAEEEPLVTFEEEDLNPQEDLPPEETTHKLEIDFFEDTPLPDQDNDTSFLG